MISDKKYPRIFVDLKKMCYEKINEPGGVAFEYRIGSISDAVNISVIYNEKWCEALVRDGFVKEVSIEEFVLIDY